MVSNQSGILFYIRAEIKNQTNQTLLNNLPLVVRFAVAVEFAVAAGLVGAGVITELTVKIVLVFRLEEKNCY